MRLGIRALAGLLGLTLWFAWGCSEKPEEDTTVTDAKQTRAMMREIFNGVRVVLPASVDPDEFSDPANRENILAAFEILARNTQMLDDHTLTQNQKMHFLARSVARDASDAQRHFEEKRYERSAFVLRQIAENCVVCHTRLPDLEDSEVAVGFVDVGAMESLPLEPRATLQIATRRFDDALASLSELLEDPATHPAIMLGPLTDYFVVAIRVKGDFDRTAAMLATFGQREDLWASLKRDVAAWIEELPALRKQATAKPNVATARNLIDAATADDQEGDGQSGLLQLVVASAILERFIDSHPEQDPALGEALYLLGTLEARIGRNYWVTPAPFLLEQSIRLAPGEPFAAEALAILERELHAEYEGSDYELLPADDQSRLTELRLLIQGGNS